MLVLILSTNFLQNISHPKKPLARYYDKYSVLHVQ